MRVFLFITLTLASPLLFAQSPAQRHVVQTPMNVQPSQANSPNWSTVTIYMNQPAAQAGPVLHQAFSGVEVRHSQQTLSNGTHIDHSVTSHIYRDAQGRMRIEGSKVVVLFDPTTDSTYTLHLQEKTYDQHPAGGGKYSTTISAFGNSSNIDTPGSTPPVQTVRWDHVPYGAEPVSHFNTTQLGTKTINGLVCKGTRVTMTIPAHAVGNDRDIHVVNERWYSDDLEVLVKSENNDPRFGTTSYVLQDVSRHDPDPSLFQLPTGFTKSSRN